jgi:hypothetical protein
VCILVEIYRRFGRKYCLHLQGNSLIKENRASKTYFRYRRGKEPWENQQVLLDIRLSETFYRTPRRHITKYCTVDNPRQDLISRIFTLLSSAECRSDMAQRTYGNSATRQAPGQRWSPQLKDRGCDTVLRGQGYSTIQRAVTDGYGAMMEWWLVGENRRNPEMDVLHYDFAHSESHTNSHVINLSVKLLLCVSVGEAEVRHHAFLISSVSRCNFRKRPGTQKEGKSKENKGQIIK